MADSERIASYYQARGYKSAGSIDLADDIVINTCMIRQSAEDRVYGLVNKIGKEKKSGRNVKLIVTGCMVGMAVRDKSGKIFSMLRKKLLPVDEFLPIEEVGFDFSPLRTDDKHAWVPISNGCNNFCTYCVVPYTRGREISRPPKDIVDECISLSKAGYARLTLLGQNVNSYGNDLFQGSQNSHKRWDVGKTYFRSHPIDSIKFKYEGKPVKPVFTKHLGRLRIPTLFPYLLDSVCAIPGVTEVDFISSNPWDFTDELIATIARNKKISRHIHLPFQSGDDQILIRMNRWYSGKDYLKLVNKLKKNIPGLTISTDIIVGFCGETDEQFNNTVSLCRKIGFSKAYISMYSDRLMTTAHKIYSDSVPHTVKKQRWEILDEMINKTNLRNGTYK